MGRLVVIYFIVDQHKCSRDEYATVSGRFNKGYAAVAWDLEVIASLINTKPVDTDVTGVSSRRIADS